MIVVEAGGWVHGYSLYCSIFSCDISYSKNIFFDTLMDIILYITCSLLKYEPVSLVITGALVSKSLKDLI